MIRKVLTAAAVVLAVGAVLIQLVPYRVHNPAPTQPVVWDSPETEALARRACYDCHSNEVVVPWYGYVAPVAWIVRRQVDEARAAMNLSEMDRPQEEAHEAGEVVTEGEMPPNYYLRLHPEARLTDAERRALAAGLDATLGGEGDGSAGAGRLGAADEDEDDDS